MLFLDKETFNGEVSYELGFGRLPLLRVYVPATMLFMTDFRMFLYILFPTMCIGELYLNQLYREIEARKVVQIEEDGYLKNEQHLRDLAFFASIFAGVYSHSSTLVHRFMTHETSKTQ